METEKTKKTGNAEDLRVQKTKARLKESLVELLNHRSIDELTISELCEKASINRKTFYAHYSSIDELVAECQNDSAKNLIELLRCFLMENEGQLSPNYLFACLNVICRQTIPFLESAQEVEKNHLLFQKYTTTLQEVVVENMKSFAQANGVDETSLEFIASFIAGGIVNTYYEWLKNPHDLTIDQVSELTSTMITSGLVTM